MKISVILYLPNELSDGTYPITLRITQGNVRKYQSLGISCAKELWDFNNNTPSRGHPNKEAIKAIISQIIHTYQSKLLELVANQKAVTPSALIKAVEHDAGGKANKVFPFFDLIIDRLLQSGKVGNASVYKDTKRSLKLFASSKDLLFTDIDQTFLINYEVYLRKLNLAGTSMSVYFRTLRALFNKAIQEKVVNLNVYPFKEFSVAKFNTDTKKRALTKEELKRIENLELDPASFLAEAQYIFITSYYGQGINFIDIAKLKWKDIIQGRIFYTRAKTGKIINFKISSPAQAIIEHYKPLTGSHPENYIFPILNRLKHITPLQIGYRTKKVLRRVNSSLKEIAQLALIERDLTFYTARHTYAMVLKESGVTLDVIREAMAHDSTRTTDRYLRSFKDEVVDEANECLL